MVLHADLDALAQQVHLDDGAAAVGRIDEGFRLRRGLDEVLIGLLLVFEAAHEPPASAGDLGGVQTEVLRLGHLDGDGLEIVEEFLAAERTAAHAESADHLGLVAHADLPELDARAEGGRQILDQLAEVHAALGREEEQDLAAVKRAFRRDELHVELVRENLLLADVKGFFLFFLIFRVDALVVFRRRAQNLPQRQDELARADRVVPGGADAEFVAAGRVDDDMVAHRERQPVRVKEVGFRVVAEADVHDRDGRGLCRSLGLGSGSFCSGRFRGGGDGCIFRGPDGLRLRICGRRSLLQNGIGVHFLHGILQSAAKAAR